MTESKNVKSSQALPGYFYQICTDHYNAIAQRAAGIGDLFCQVPKEYVPNMVAGGVMLTSMVTSLAFPVVGSTLVSLSSSFLLGKNYDNLYNPQDFANPRRLICFDILNITRSERARSIRVAMLLSLGGLAAKAILGVILGLTSSFLFSAVMILPLLVLTAKLYHQELVHSATFKDPAAPKMIQQVFTEFTTVLTQTHSTK